MSSSSEIEEQYIRYIQYIRDYRKQARPEELHLALGFAEWANREQKKLSVDSSPQLPMTPITPTVQAKPNSRIANRRPIATPNVLTPPHSRAAMHLNTNHSSVPNISGSSGIDPYNSNCGSDDRHRYTANISSSSPTMYRDNVNSTSDPAHTSSSSLHGQRRSAVSSHLKSHICPPKSKDFNINNDRSYGFFYDEISKYSTRNSHKDGAYDSEDRALKRSSCSMLKHKTPQAPDHVDAKTIQKHIQYISRVVDTECARKQNPRLDAEEVFFLDRPVLATVTFNRYQIYCGLDNCTCFDRLGVPHFIFCPIGLDDSIAAEEFFSDSPSDDINQDKQHQWALMKAANKKAHAIWLCDHNKVSQKHLSPPSHYQVLY